MPAPKSRSRAEKLHDDPLPAGTGTWSGRPRHEGVTTHPWKFAGATAVPLIQPGCAQYVIDAADTIVAHKCDANFAALVHQSNPIGHSLRTLLAEARPEWEQQLPPCLFDAETSLYLPEIMPGASGLVLAIHRLRVGENMFVTAVPELAPPSMLKQVGIGDFFPDPATFAKLFLRLRTVENRLDHYLAHLPGVVFHQRADLSFAYIGPGCEGLIGLTPQSLSKDSQALLRLIHPSDERDYYQELDRNASATKPFSLVYRVLNPQTGTCIYLLDVRSPLHSTSGLLLGYEGVWLDITRQKIAEHRLTTRTWKENLSTLTSGLLHDFGNVMTGIFSLSELYHNTLPAKHPLHDGLGLIKENAAVAQRLVNKIIELNKESAGDKSYVNLGKVIRDQLDLIKVILPRGTQLIGLAEDGDWPVYIDEISFRQILVNLAMNSRDALRGNGEIAIFLRRLAPCEPPSVGTVPALPAGDRSRVELVFADNGVGISPVHLPRIFDPFFTTKENTRGSGLGLYNARLFAESHGGLIAARSTLGHGTEIVLVLPLADLSIENPADFEITDRLPRMQKRVRVLHLEPGMVEEGSLVEQLRARDWQVRSVSTAEHARRVLREEGAKLDLVLLRQPQIDAELRILIAEIRRDHRGLPVALALTGQHSAELPQSLTTQVDLLLADDIRDRDAAESLSKLLRLP